MSRLLTAGAITALALSALAQSAPALSAPASSMPAPSTQIPAETPRDLLTTAAFQTSDKNKALALIGRAIAASDTILAAHPGDREATLQRGIGIGYRAKLTRSRSDAEASRQIFEGLAARNPNDAEAQMVLAGWHLDAVDQLGGMTARLILGARAQLGDQALARALALGGGRPFFTGLAAMMRIRQSSPDIALARRLAESAATAPTSTPLDGLMKRAAAAILPALRANNAKAAATLARKLLPFGQLGG
jgi:hypothetical protein